MKGNIRWIFLLIFVLVIIGMSILVYKNKDSWFATKTTIKYPDGCVEEYKGTKLLTDECTEGRLIVEENRAGVRRKKNYSIGNIVVKWNLTTNNQSNAA